MSKFALLIGINYIGTNSRLYGCQNDIINFAPILTSKYGYSNKNIVSLMDRRGYQSPTLKNIKDEINKLIILSKKKKASEVLIYYSGHGTNIIDKNKDESDGYDECLVPLDYNNSGFITDDYIYYLLSSFSNNTKVIFIFDSCNSASNTDLPVSYLNKKNTIVTETYSKRASLNKNIFIISGCADDNYSYDTAEPDGTPCGLLSYSIRKTIEQNNYSCNIKQLLEGIYSIITSYNLDQVPVISVGSESININTPVFILEPKKGKIGRNNKKLLNINKRNIIKTQLKAQQQPQEPCKKNNIINYTILFLLYEFAKSINK